MYLLLTIQTSTPLLSQQSDCQKIENKKANKVYEKAIDAYKIAKYSETIKLLHEVISIEPAFTDAYFVMGLIYIKDSRMNLKAATENFLKVIEICPNYDIYAYYHLGRICFGAEEWEKTEKYLKEFLKDVEKIKSDDDYNKADEMYKTAQTYMKLIKNPVPFNPTKVAGISSQADEYLPIISPDGEMALYTRRDELVQSKLSWQTEKVFKERFTFSILNNGSFDNGNPMPIPFNQKDNEGGATITIDNKFLVYTICDYVNSGSYLNCDLCYSRLEEGYWTDIENLGKKVNQSDTWESQPSINSEGNCIYFVSDRKGGYGGYDIYVTKKDDKGEWGSPENLGPTINTKGNEKTPFIHTDSQTLYYASDGLPGLGGYDIFFSKIKENNKWSKPINIGYPINSKDDDAGLFVSTDGRFGYFASNKLNGKGGWDLYSFPLYEEAKPEKILFVKGELKDENTRAPVQGKIEMTNVITRKIIEIPVDTLTGKYVAVLPFINDYVMTIKKQGYAYESKYIAKADTVFDKPAIVNIEVKPVEVGQTYKLNDIYFKFNAYDLTLESMTVIDGFVEFLNENKDIKIEIQGHTDDIGDGNFNQKLSENRAESVYDYIILKGIQSSRLLFKGYGESKPITSNQTEEGRAKNRRTVFVITDK